jgi:signal transduction histidine kinase
MKITLKLTLAALLGFAILLLIRSDGSAGSADVDNAVRALALLGPCVLLVGILGFTLVGRPIRRLIEVVRRYGSGDLTPRIELRQQDEIGELAHRMSQMGEKLALAQQRADEEAQAHLCALEQLRHADRLATVGKLTSSIAHELGTPLSTISNRALMIARGEVSGDEAKENARIIAEQSDRMTGIIRQTLTYARRRGPHRRSVNLEALTRQAFSLVRPLASKHRVYLRVEVQTPEPVAEVDPGQLLQVLTNLFTNGVQAMPAGGALTVVIARRHLTPPEDAGLEGEHICIEVRDQGKGIPIEHQHDIFDAFFTTKAPGEGTGLGLPIAQGIVRGHGGWMEVKSEVGKGSSFNVYFPLEGVSCPPGS